LAYYCGVGGSGCCFDCFKNEKEKGRANDEIRRPSTAIPTVTAIRRPINVGILILLRPPIANKKELARPALFCFCKVVQGQKLGGSDPPQITKTHGREFLLLVRSAVSLIL